VAGVGGGWREAARQAAFVSQHNEIINCSQATDKRTTDNGHPCFRSSGKPIKWAALDY